MSWILLVAGVVAAAVCGAAGAADDGFAPFPVDWGSEGDSPADLSSLLDAPAGKGGFVRVAEGHIVRPDGRRLRLWGVNVSMAAGLPAKEHAPRIARRLAQSGVNCVRFHFFDILAPGGIIAAGRDDTRAFDESQIDRLDAFIAELKKRGIYSNLNLNVGRSYKGGDGVKDHELLGFAKALTYFDPRLLELQKEYARMLLTHRNPYTQSEYRQEPAVAIVELVNENSLVEAWACGRLLGRNTTKNPGTWTDITAGYEKALTDAYDAFLRGRLAEADLAALRMEAGAAAGEPIPRLRPAEFARASKLRFQTEAAFYVETERRYFQDMARFLREDLGVGALLLGSSDHNHGISGYPHLASTSLLDVVDGHVYWQHPQYIRDPGSRRMGFRIPNTPMVLDPLYSTVVQLSRSAVAGKPYTISEVNHPFPSEYACEGVPILGAYAAFHDWDGVFWYTLGHKDVVAASPQAAIGHFDLFCDPVKMAQLRAGALMFLRRDVSEARQTIARSYGRQQVLESLRLGRSEGPLFTPGLDPAVPLMHAVRVQSFDERAPGPAGGPATGPSERPGREQFRSDTGELTWHAVGRQRGLLAVQTPRSQALIGHLKAAPSLANLAVQVDTPFCAVTLHALDDRPISGSARLLLTACGRTANTDMRWDAQRKTLEQWGKAPVRIEPVTGSVVLQNLQGAAAVTAQPLDGAGLAMSQPLAAARSDAGWTLPVGKPPTTWYIIRVAR